VVEAWAAVRCGRQRVADDVRLSSCLEMVSALLDYCIGYLDSFRALSVCHVTCRLVVLSVLE
jgi:hypothetical protein